LLFVMVVGMRKKRKTLLKQLYAIEEKYF